MMSYRGLGGVKNSLTIYFVNSPGPQFPILMVKWMKICINGRPSFDLMKFWRGFNRDSHSRGKWESKHPKNFSFAIPQLPNYCRGQRIKLHQRRAYQLVRLHMFF